MPIFLKNKKVRLTRHEENLIRTRAARNGVAVHRIETFDDLLSSVIDGLSDEVVCDMLEFMESGSSTLTQQGKRER